MAGLQASPYKRAGAPHGMKGDLTFLPSAAGPAHATRTDYRAAAAYINRQGGMRSAQLLGLARWLLLWVHTHLLSIRAEYIPGVLNRGADIMSRGALAQTSGASIPIWRPDLAPVWQGRGGSVCQQGERSVRPLVFTEPAGLPPAGSGRLLTPPLASPAAVCFSASAADPALSGSPAVFNLGGDSGGPGAHQCILVSLSLAVAGGAAVETPLEGGCSLSAGGAIFTTRLKLTANIFFH